MVKKFLMFLSFFVLIQTAHADGKFRCNAIYWDLQSDSTIARDCNVSFHDSSEKPTFTKVYTHYLAQRNKLPRRMHKEDGDSPVYTDRFKQIIPSIIPLTRQNFTKTYGSSDSSTNYDISVTWLNNNEVAISSSYGDGQCGFDEQLDATIAIKKINDSFFHVTEYHYAGC